MGSYLGLFDMLGNVSEWVQDRSGRPEQANDEINMLENFNISDHRLLLGGTFHSQAAYVRSARRSWDAPSNRGANYGFRPSRTYP